MRRKPFFLLLSLGAALISGEAFAGDGRIKSADVTALLVDDTNFGGCMAELSPGPETILGDCDADWVTFDCLGGFPESTKANASQKFSQAQLALVMSNKVRVYITNDRIVNGFCFGTRIDIIAE